MVAKVVRALAAPPRIARRPLLRWVLAASAAAAGCAANPSPRAAPAASAPVELVLQFMDGGQPDRVLQPLAAAFEQADGGRVRLRISTNGLENPDIALGNRFQIFFRTLRDHSPLLRAANVPVDGLLPGLAEACTDQNGRLRALPYSIQPTALTVDPAALQKDRGGMVPAAGWPMRDFVSLATAVGPDAPVPLLYPVAAGRASPTDPPIWTAFVRGYGGELWTGGRLVLTDAGALAGLDALSRLTQAVGWAKQPLSQYPCPHGPPQALCPPNIATVFDFPSQDREWLTVAAAPSASSSDAAPSRVLVPFPPGPAEDVVPTDIGVMAILRDRQMDAAAAFLGFVLSDAGQTVLAGLGIPPVLRNPPPAAERWWQQVPAAVRDSRSKLWWPPAPLVSDPVGRRVNPDLYKILWMNAADRHAALRATEDAANALLARA